MRVDVHVHLHVHKLDKTVSCTHCDTKHIPVIATIFCVNSLATAFQHDHTPPSHWAEITSVTHQEPISRGQCLGCALESDRSGA